MITPKLKTKTAANIFEVRLTRILIPDDWDIVRMRYKVPVWDKIAAVELN